MRPLKSRIILLWACGVALTFTGCKKVSDPPLTTAAALSGGSSSCTNNTSAVLTSLTGLRTALSQYFSNNSGAYPVDLQTALVPQYLSAIPSITICNQASIVAHASSNAITYSNVPTTNDAGGWLYDNSMASANWGTILVNSAGNSPQGVPWTSY